MTAYNVSINLDNETSRALTRHGFSMHIFKGVKSANIRGALPTLWFSTNDFSNNHINVAWESRDDSYGGYFSEAKLQSGEIIQPSFEHPMTVGDVMTYNNGAPSVSTKGGAEGSFTFVSDKTSEIISGLLEKNPNRKLTPICAFPQFSTINNLVSPYEKILILFTENDLNISTAVSITLSVSISIKLSIVYPSAEIAFNINKGWDKRGNLQATINPKNFALAKDLIISSKSLLNLLEAKK